MHHFWVPNGSFALKPFFEKKKKSQKTFSSTYWPLSLCKILKKFLKPIQIYEDVPFSGPKYPNLSWTNFLVQTIIITVIYLLALFIGQNLKKILTVDPELWGPPFLGPKWSNCPKQIFFFFGKLLILLSSTY